MQKYVLLCIAAFGVLMLICREYSLQPTGTLQVHIGNVGQGDGILLTSPSGKHVVIDGGPNLDLLSFLGTAMPWFDRTVELLVLTHPDADHITALPELINRYRVQAILMTAIDHNSGRYEALLQGIDTQNIPIITPQLGQIIELGDGAKLEVLWPTTSLIGVKPDRPNDTSVVLRASFGSKSILLAGDIEAAAEAALLATGQNLRADYLKIPHHGSSTSTSTGFLLAVNPTYAVITAGKDNKFGHPHSEVTNRLDHFNIPYWITGKDGNLRIDLDSTK